MNQTDQSASTGLKRPARKATPTVVFWSLLAVFTVGGAILNPRLRETAVETAYGMTGLGIFLFIFVGLPILGFRMFMKATEPPKSTEEKQKESDDLRPQ